MSVSYMTHPLIRHKITLLRKEDTSTNEFRKLVEEIAMLMGYEALSDLETQDITVKTPIEESVQPVISGKKLAVVPILRAGLGMVNGILALVPSARVGHIGLYRDPETHAPHEYYCKLPDPIDQRQIVVVDPMLATGGSAIAAVDFIKKHGGQKIKFMSIIAAPEGVDALMNAHPTFSFMSAVLTVSLTKMHTSAPAWAMQATEFSAQNNFFKHSKSLSKNAQAFSVSHKRKCSSVKSVSGLGCAKQDKVFQNKISFGITFKEQGLRIYL